MLEKLLILFKKTLNKYESLMNKKDFKNNNLVHHHEAKLIAIKYQTLKLNRECNVLSQYFF